MTDRRPPAPDGLPVLGNAVAFVRDPFGFIAAAVAEHGDVFRLSLPGEDKYVLAHPEYLERALVTEPDAFAKTDDFRLAFGESVLAVEGEAWREQRELLDPFFFFRRIRSYAPQMRAQATRRVESWTPGETYSMVEEMKGLTFDVLGSTLLGRDPTGDGGSDAELRAAADNLNARFSPESWALPEWVPTRNRRRFDDAVSTLRAEVRRLLREANANTGTNADSDADAEEPDLLSVLAGAREGDGYPRTDAAVSDQLVGMVFAGHETTALALTFVWYLLARNPDARARLHEEVDAVVGDDPVEMSQLADLTYTERVFEEALRLYPPIHTLPRETTREVAAGDYRIPAGSEVLLSVVNVHRDGRFYDDPAAFDPDRWTDERAAARPDYAYAPFGAGPRRCMGRAFATVEAKLVIAEVTRRYRLEWAGDGDLSVRPQMTTQPVGGVPMRVEER
ncbi:cytochrome P450 [Halopelagius longus]|uniref:Cytochrome P450 n=1 Tax=Halopelagius longus TaxID=1236180 RepID=A0A1H1AM54_9EURY|nr:cytochrome P450 [Halopelagius longus]RDI70418.1 cytochrome P450 [Halopelagius longus]SDQ40296.1 Cytochrome P450 [Halopelagius longus]